jgi:hypothetical protein
VHVRHFDAECVIKVAIRNIQEPSCLYIYNSECFYTTLCLPTVIDFMPPGDEG